MWETHKRDMEMLKLLAIQEKKMVASHYNLSLRGLDSWIHRVRERRREYQWYINNILNFEKRSSRMKKILLSSKLPARADEADKVTEYLATATSPQEEAF